MNENLFVTRELSIKEGLFMKQKGESTSTVERVRLLQEEIQGLRWLEIFDIIQSIVFDYPFLMQAGSYKTKTNVFYLNWQNIFSNKIIYRSQNDQLRAEIEAQSAAQKAQINAAEIRAHDSWLAAKQGERRLEEARSEASMLRKKLTNLTLIKTSAENHFSSTKIHFNLVWTYFDPEPVIVGNDIEIVEVRQKRWIQSSKFSPKGSGSKMNIDFNVYIHIEVHKCSHLNFNIFFTLNFPYFNRE